jgi:hypothetical protein
MSDLSPTLCCGVDVYEGINDPRMTGAEVLRQIAVNWLVDSYEEELRRTAVVFTEARRNRRRKPLVLPGSIRPLRPLPPMPTCWRAVRSLIKKNKMGTVTTSPWRVNPNSANEVRVHVWTVNWPQYRRYMMDTCEDYNAEILSRQERRRTGRLAWGTF